MPLIVSSPKQIAYYEDRILQAARKLQRETKSSRSAQELIYRLKFEEMGLHPLEGSRLNAIEQVNQTWTYLVALAGARRLLKHHPNVGGFSLAPGANSDQPLDIMSVVPKVVGAECFAAVNPMNNDKIRRDLQKMATCGEQFRYVIYFSPNPLTAAAAVSREAVDKGVKLMALALSDLAPFADHSLF